MKKRTFCIVCVSIGLFAIILTFIMLFVAKNNEANHYEDLNSQKQLIMNNFNNVYSLKNYIIEERDNKIAITLKSGNISATCLFDKEHNFIEVYSTISLLDDHVFSTLLIGFSSLIISLVITALFIGIKHGRFKA